MKFLSHSPPNVKRKQVLWNAAVRCPQAVFHFSPPQVGVIGKTITGLLDQTDTRNNWTLSLLSSVCITCLILQLLDSFKLRSWNSLSQGNNQLETKLEPVVIFSPCGWKKTLFGVSQAPTFRFHQCLEALKVKNERKINGSLWRKTHSFVLTYAQGKSMMAAALNCQEHKIVKCIVEFSYQYYYNFKKNPSSTLFTVHPNVKVKEYLNYEMGKYCVTPNW